tara:strand:- start:1159 stop:1323 length:165 start_codon:yes stop_codon:yes gene_type:complete
MNNPVLVDDDAPRKPSQIDDALVSAQQKRFLKQLTRNLLMTMATAIELQHQLFQ